ncbi:MAG: hypothetical protein M3146_09055 [Thermoproteota archaeon]|nr:hypothetical protein [Thermoproteota archaeon]
MDTQIDTIVGNKKSSKELIGMLVDLRDTASNYINDIEDRLEKIRVKAHSEHFSKKETIGLVKQYLKGSSLTDNQVKWLVYDKPRRLEQKKLKEKLSTSRIDANMLEEETITLPTELKILPQDLEEFIQEQQAQEQGHEQQGNLILEDLEKSQVLDYAKVELELQLDIVQKKFDQAIEDKNSLKKKISN